MTHTPTTPPNLNAAQAVALSLLNDGYTQRAIHLRTGVTPDDLYTLAAAHSVTAPCGTVEGHHCHQTRSEDPCGRCQAARGRADARARAQQRKRPTSLGTWRPGRTVLSRRAIHRPNATTAGSTRTAVRP